MKKASVIVAVVAGYSLVEAGLLLSTFVSHQGYYYPSTYQLTMYFGQLLLIPGLAALLSRIMYGSYRWRTRTLTILLIGVLGVPIGITVLGIVTVPLTWAFDISRALFYLLLLVTLVGVVFGSLVVKRRSEKWEVRAETARWLSERTSGIDSREIKLRNRGIRLAVWLPSLMVLLVFLFLPEALGMFSQLSLRQSGDLSGYRVRIPETWIVLRHENEAPNGWSTTSGLAGRGIWAGFSPYLRGPSPFASWSIETRR